MPWPLSQDYNEAIQDMASSFGEADLKQGEAATNALGIPMPRSGNFADVYEVTTPKGKWAVKCFTRQIPGIRERQPKKFKKDAGTEILLDFSGEGKTIKDLAGNHDGKIVDADWVVGAAPEPDPIPTTLQTPGLRLKGNSFIELAKTAGLLDGKEFCVEVWFKTPPFTGQPLDLFGDQADKAGWHLYCNPKRGGDKKWEVMLAVGSRYWFQNDELEPSTVYHIAAVRSLKKGGEGEGLRIHFNGNQPTLGVAVPVPASTANFFIGQKTGPAALASGEIHAFRASSVARYHGGFIPPQQFTKDADTVILLEFSGKGTRLKDLAGDHDGKIINASWITKP